MQSIVIGCIDKPLLFLFTANLKTDSDSFRGKLKKGVTIMNRSRKNQYQKLKLREGRLKKQKPKKSSEAYKKYIDAASNANLTDAVASFDFKLLYDFKD